MLMVVCAIQCYAMPSWYLSFFHACLISLFILSIVLICKHDIYDIWYKIYDTWYAVVSELQTMLQLVSSSSITRNKEEKTTSTSTTTTSDPFAIPPYVFSGGLNKSKSQYGGLGLGMDEASLSELPDGELPRPTSVSRSHSAPHRSLTKEERLEFSLSPWLGIYRLLTHPSVNATEPDKQVSKKDCVDV